MKSTDRGTMKYFKMKQMIFLTIFFISAFFTLFIQSELYLSSSSVIIKDLKGQEVSLGLGLLSTGSSSTMQDSKVLEAYLNSYDELQKLDAKFHLLEHYRSDKVDPIDRLYSFSTKEDFLALYQSRLQILYDEISGILTIGFMHTDPKVAKAIVEQLIQDSNEKINEYNHIVAQKKLSFIEKQVKENKRALEEAIQKIKTFQNQHTLLNPQTDAETQSTIVANLEAQLVEDRTKLNELRSYMNEKSFEVIRLKHEIDEIEKTLQKIRSQLANENSSSLNTIIFEFERLKNIATFNKEVYKESLIQFEKVKAEINQNAKMLLVLTKPYEPQGYTEPNKLKALLTITLILGLLYGIISLIEAIIKEHLD